MVTAQIPLETNKQTKVKQSQNQEQKEERKKVNLLMVLWDID